MAANENFFAGKMGGFRKVCQVCQKFTATIVHFFLLALDKSADL
jgi:hypothetical protein